MYAVQVYIMATPVSTTSTPRPKWLDHTVVEQLVTDHAERREALAVARILTAYYHDVRVVKYTPGGESFEVIR